jgi:hypothetical protein
VLTVLSDSWDAFASKSKAPTAEMVKDLPNDVLVLEKKLKKLIVVLVKLKLKSYLLTK